MRKYYIDSNPNFSEKIEKWDLIISSLSQTDQIFEVVEALLGKSDSDDRRETNSLLSKTVLYFSSQQPFERTVSLSPFLIKNCNNSVCFKYHITDKIVYELKSSWRKELMETLIIPSFIIYENKTPILWYNYNQIVVLLGEGELNLWSHQGFKLSEYELDLNSIIYGMPS